MSYSDDEYESVCDALKAAEAERDRLREVLKAVSTALPVLQTMCRVVGLKVGEAKAAEMIGWINAALAKEAEQ